MNYDMIKNKLEYITTYLQKEKKKSELGLNSSVNSLIESGKINNRLSCVKYKERLNVINNIIKIIEE